MKNTAVSSETGSKVKNLLKRKGTSDTQSGKFGTFGGVFAPTVLTILGVIMYLRLGWVVGNAGLIGAIAIILLATSITFCTALSMASITTNIKIGAGGAYSIISRSLGLETGGSVGIPFYVSQTLSAALYIIGFTEGWLRIFPHHPPLAVALLTWVVLMAISYISTQFAIRIQYVIMALIGFSLVSFYMGPAEPAVNTPLLGTFEDGGFWYVFSIFFPAVTGIMAGANMSGDLKNPRKSIPQGTLTGVAITTVVYIILVILLATRVPPEVLRSNQMVMVDYAAFKWAVIIGILAATFSSALGSILGAPRILEALAQQGTVPFSRLFAKRSARNEPTNAIIFTGAIIVLALLPGNLDFLATLITMFFLITYGMLNLVVFIQQTMKIISFRPTFRIPRFVSFYGAAGCIFMMFLINPIFSAVAITIIILLYVWLTRRGLQADWGDIRGGMFLVLAERASRIAAKFPRHKVSWKPDLLLPVDDPKVWAGPLLFIRNITYPAGSIFAFTVKKNGLDETQKDLDELLVPLRQENLFVNSTVIEDSDFVHGARLVIQTLKGGAFRPNCLFLTLGDSEDKDYVIEQLVAESSRHDLGVLILRQHPRVAFGMQKTINLWLREKSPNWHLAVLIALQLQLNWEGRLNLIASAESEKDKRRAYRFLERLTEQARLPSLTEYFVLLGGFQDSLAAAPRADVNLFGLGEKPSFSFMRGATDWTNASCLFVKDSGMESALV
ncbi:MAG: Na-K-Cl cotransporter [Calditrichaeota bacterium]|nr:MAG: Na-K-Cl cotransporter [Calditrichota bacterium]